MSFPINISENSAAILSTVATQRGMTAPQYMESIIMAICLPELLTSVGANPVKSSPTQPSLASSPSKKKRKKYTRDKRKIKSWMCPTCDKKFTTTGGRMHFLSCGLKSGNSLRDLAIFIKDDEQSGGLRRSFKIEDKTVDEIEEAFANRIKSFPTWNVPSNNNSLRSRNA